MGKPFKESKVGKFIFSSVGVGLAKSIPVVGGLLGNVLSENNTPAGKIDGQEIKSDIAQFAVIALVIAYLMGWLSFEQVEGAKELLIE